MFPVTPMPGVTESLRGYQLRLAERNGYLAPKWIVDTLQNSRTYHAREALDAAPLREWAGLSCEQVALLTMRGSGQKHRIRGVDLDRQAFQLHRPKVCPRCLAENGWCEAFWDLRMAIACPIHRVLLVDRCEHCGRELTWRRGKVSRCRCGHDLTSSPTVNASAAVCDVMEVLRHSVYRDDAIAPLPPSMQHLHHLGLRQLHRLLSAFSLKCRRRADATLASDDTANDTAAIENTTKILANWPWGLHQFLDREIRPSVEKNGAFPRYNSFLGWLADLDSVENGEDRSAFAFLEEEVRHHLVGMLADSAFERCISSGSCAPGPQGEIARANQAEAVATPGANATTQCCGNTDDHPIAWSGSASSLLSMSLQAAADQLGMSIETLRALRDLGTFSLTLRGAQRTHLSRHAVDELGETLKSWVQGRASTGESPCLTVAQSFTKFGALHGERAAFFVWLAECPSRVEGCASTNGGADAMQVEATSVAEFFNSLRSRRTQAA